ncbi:uncharacterized protein LOC142334062 [Lycorma delicatula]|uniref:uncharacterized protein LOC142334062 n=1 Tax=Lycorma delicatula TaxID=130591 RepID=UPI003F5184D8
MNRSSVLLKIYIFFSVFDILPQKFVVSTFNKEILNYVQQTTELSDSVTDFGFIYASLVKNLTVNVRVFRMGSRKKLQLYISWIKPTEGRIPDNYNLHVFPSNTSLNDHCGDEVYYGFIRDPEITNWSVPEYSQLKINGLHDGLTILPECTYYVTLESNPHNGKLASRSMFTVPGKLS